ncbi:MAG: hypothetical protein WBV82_26985 [Myxococcaceae bacterium]
MPTERLHLDSRSSVVPRIWTPAPAIADRTPSVHVPANAFDQDVRKADTAALLGALDTSARFNGATASERELWTRGPIVGNPAFDVPAGGGTGNLNLSHPAVLEGLRRLGLSPTDLLNASGAVQPVLDAAVAASKGDWKGALKHLIAAAPHVAPLVEKGIIKAASQLESDGAEGIARSLLTDPRVVRQLVTNRKLHGSVIKLVNGDVSGAIRGMMGQQAVAKDVANALAKNSTVKSLMAPLGLTNGEDLFRVGKAIPEAMELAQKVRVKDLAGSVRELGDVLGTLPLGLRTRMMAAIAAKLDLPPWLANAVAATGSLLGNDAVGEALLEVAKAVKAKDLPDFTHALAKMGRVVADTDPAAATAFLNALSGLPGSMGKLFKNAELNAAVVETKTVSNLFEALERLAVGNLNGAMDELGQAAGALLTTGRKVSIGGKEFPISEEGIRAASQLFERFFDALPATVKKKITEAVAKLAAQAGFSAVPIVGDLVVGTLDAAALVKLKREGGSGLDITLAGAKLAVDVVGALQLSKGITVPLRLAIGTAQVVKTTTDLIDSVRDFQKAFAGF